MRFEKYIKENPRCFISKALHELFCFSLFGGPQMHDSDIIYSLARCLTGMFQLSPSTAVQWTTAIPDILNIPLVKCSSMKIISFMLLFSQRPPS